MDETDREILKILQDDIPLVSRPFLEVAKKFEISEEEVIRRIKKMMSEGIVRRFSASIRHRKLGITANPLVAWKVPERRVEEVGEKLASFEEVTHCYERAIIPGKWEYNVYTMIHGYDRDDVKKTAEKLSDAIGIKDYELLYSSKEFKKTYKRYG
ncbi:MAG: Lrp/AsnC family transcriptional regulator [Euryarchaeota archaeon]|nr:Lrp/AsnC family transcriptional regulator [Euryarchaeota archaeon]